MAARRHSEPQSAHDVLPVDLGERGYDIVIGAGVLDECGTRAASIARPGRCALITNPVVAELYAERVQKSLRAAGFEPLQIDIPEGEEHKSVASLERVYDALVDARFERSSLLFALGGGVIGDLTGFAAATYLRGVAYVQLPTTLLAQVDSSVGGKTAVNHPRGKNLIGAFHQPRLVLSDLATLRTLPRRELVAGLVEVIKYGVILDAAFFAVLEQNIERLLELDVDLVQYVVKRSCEIKAEVVRRDEKEADYRAVLNFGHTIGHAVESLTGYRRYLHGEAVAIGMAFAARLSVSKAGCKEDQAERVVRLLQRAGAPTDLPRDLDEAAIAAAVASDKKVAAGQVKFVCLEGLGRTRFVGLSNREIAEHAARLRAGS